MTDDRSTEQALDITADIASLTAALVDFPSESHHEELLADAVEKCLSELAHLEVFRQGNTIVARTTGGRAERVLIGGHLDTVPAADNLPSRTEGGRIYGLGACDMKGGVAVALKCAALVDEPVRDVTYVFYECEEVAGEFNGLEHLAQSRPDLLVADLAILMEPSNAGVEAGCQGTLRAQVRTRGERAHSARSWLGDNAIHNASPILQRLADYQPQRVVIDGLQYREGLNAVGISGGVAGNVIPDECTVTVNYRFAPSLSIEDAQAHVREVFEGFEVDFVDLSPGALPGVDRPATAAFIAAVKAEPKPKYGWTDVARFSAVGVPALNYGPGDPGLAHTRGEYVEIADLVACEEVFLAWLRG